MIISPIIIIIVVAVLIATAVLYIINKPKKPIFTGVFLGLLLISVVFTMVINIELSATSPLLNADNNFFKILADFITMEKSPSKAELARTFLLLQITDIVLIVISIITSILEMRVLFRNNTSTLSEDMKK
ncbi:MAG: hypothetical protein IJU14_08135 [Clostridia bacterium]|nr:hypothetical protein [Clostridia bacterium]